MNFSQSFYTTKNFEPQISKYIFATTGQRDRRIQELARKITDEHTQKGFFPVNVFFWEDILERLTEHDVILKRHYRDIFPEQISEIKEIKDDVCEIKKSISSLKSEAKDENGSNLINPKKPTKSDLEEDKFTKEMDKLVAPLNAKIGNSDFFLKGAPGYKDSRFARHQEYFSFWDKINENKYRCPDYLHLAIDNYMINKTDKVGDRTRDLSYEKAETELFEAIRKRYAELRSNINTEYHALTEDVSIAQDKPFLKFILTEWYKDIKNARFGVYVRNIGKGHAIDIKFEVV